MKTFLFMVVCLMLACSVMASQPAEFLISYWCGPMPDQTTAEAYKEVADANFNVAMPPCAAVSLDLNRKILDLCKLQGMTAIIADDRIMAKSPDDKDFAANLDAVIADYGSHPALYGYFLRDEPNAADFPRLGAVNQYLLKKDPKHLPYINLFPNYASQEQLGNPTYEEHVKQYIEVVKPVLVSYDHYALVGDQEREIWWDNLETVRRQCLAHDLPFVVIILSLPHGGYRNPTEADLRWQAYTSLAYGAKGIMYFTYWTPSPQEEWKYDNAIVSYTGKRTEHYPMVKRLNAEMKSLGRVLVGLKSTGVFHTGKTPMSTTPHGEGSLIATKDQDLVIGEFVGEKSSKYVMVVNRDLRKSRDVIFTVAKASKVIEILKSGGQATVAEGEYAVDLPVRLRFEGGEGRLFKIVR